ncbi:hypothetical protein P0136_13635 [Lentisphaerota bacterium ZTH]|nr:hypothetical protein P0136_13635 [Lentisphaerota bacterium ZTH]
MPGSLKDDSIPIYVELLTQANHPTTKGYHWQAEENRWKPVFGSNHSEIMEWGVEEFHDSILKFTEAYLRLSDINRENSNDNMVFIGQQLLNLFIHPPAMLAECLGSIPYSADQNDYELRQVAPPLTTKDSIRYILSNDKTRRFLTEWKEGSIRRSQPVARLLLRFFDVACFYEAFRVSKNGRILSKHLKRAVGCLR